MVFGSIDFRRGPVNVAIIRLAVRLEEESAYQIRPSFDRNRWRFSIAVCI